ncbi:hypothetical protein [Actinoplanes sp. NPDC051851]|uniref:hypothetical protein n=1 Tax=Actinoplanes sp. NPDC051851 TaxID=3154753 RepID=UPI003427EF4D
MSELWRAHVEARDGAVLTLRIATVHPDAGPVPGTAAFATRLLADALLPESAGGDWTVTSASVSQNEVLTVELSGGDRLLERIPPGYEWDSAAY